VPADPAVWLAATQMTQTEVSLRLARFLHAEGLSASDVDVALTGYELTRHERPRFPVVRFLTERGFARCQGGEEWRGAYRLSGATHGLRLHSEPDAGDVVARLASGERFIAHVSRGLLADSRSPAEHKLLRGVLGRAITFEHTEPRDVQVVAVPRSKRFRLLAARWRGAVGVARAGVHILTVDRAGTVDGLPATLLPSMKATH
jgi:hypothetical protein